MKKQTKVKVACAGLAVGLLTLAGCGAKVEEPFKDARRGANCEPSDWAVNRAPDGFSNTATACLLAPRNGGGCGRTGIRLTVMFKGDEARGSIATVPDPNC